MGTMYRRFPTKQALIDELLDAVLDDMIAAAQQALASHPDGTALEHYLRAAGALLFERRGFLPMVWRREQAAPRVNELRAAYADLLADGRTHGRLGDGLSTTDITAALWSLRGVMEASYAVAPDAWVRHLDFVLAGLRAGAAATTTARHDDRADRPDRGQPSVVMARPSIAPTSPLRWRPSWTMTLPSTMTVSTSALVAA